MTRDVLPMPLAYHQPAESPDVGFATLPLLGRLREALIAAYRDLPREPWGEPRLFFFNKMLQVEWNEVRARRPVPTPLADLIDDALTVMAASVEARHNARAVVGLAETAAALAHHHPQAAILAEVLAVPDDEVVRVIHPTARAGFRVLVRGIVDVNQFHTLLAEAVTGAPRDGLLPGARPHSRVVRAAQDQPADPDLIATARFQLFRSSALRTDGTLSAGFAGCDHWLHGTEPLATVRRENGERIVLLGEPVVRTTWDAARKFSWLVGELEVLEVMTAAAVGDWLAGRTGQPVTRPEATRRAA